MEFELRGEIGEKIGYEFKKNKVSYKRNYS